MQGNRRVERTQPAEASLAKRSSSKRELIDTGVDKQYVKRDGKGRFKESDDVGRALAADRRRTAQTTSKPGHGDQGDRTRSGKKR